MVECDDRHWPTRRECGTAALVSASITTFAGAWWTLVNELERQQEQEIQ
jgi:hypothetical protein